MREGENLKGLQFRGSTPAAAEIRDQKSDHGRYEELDEEKRLLVVVVVRTIAFLLWTGAILYSTLQVFIVAEDMLPFQKDPILNPGPFTEFLDRGRDSSDFEWIAFTSLLFSSLIYWYLTYLTASRMFSILGYQKGLPWLSPTMTFMLLSNLFGLYPTLFLAFMPVIYWIIVLTRSKLVVWAVTFMFLYSLGSRITQTFFEESWKYNERRFAEYYFVVTAAWNYARCISFSFDTWERPVDQKTSIRSLVSFLQYVFYLPLAVTGPLVVFEHFEKQILKKEFSKSSSSSKTSLNRDLSKLMLEITRMLLTIVFNEIVIHYLYFRPLALTIPAIYQMNLWALCGIIYWLGQFFTLKYKVMYGFASCVAEFDGLPMYPLPRCPAYLHRYSVLWKDFDRGLYIFLIRYTYVPVINFLKKVDNKQRLSPDIHKLIASFASYVYVYIWHSTSLDVLIWTVLNFLGITFERLGSLLKKKIDATIKIDALIWDFLVEPIVTVPLAAMSILNSSVFTGTLESAIAFSDRLWTDRADNYVLYFLYCFTHVAVTVRTWQSFSSTMKNSFMGAWKRLA